MVVEENSFPGINTVEGKEGSFGEFGKCCGNKLKPVLNPSVAFCFSRRSPLKSLPL